MPTSPQAETLLFDGERFTIAGDGGDRGAPLGPALGAAAVLLASLRWGEAARRVALASCGALGATTAWLALGPRAWSVAKVQPAVMRALDAGLRSRKRELLKGLRGRVLDVGSGDGPYVAYASERAELIDELVLVEPNAHLHEQLRRTAAEAAPLRCDVRGGRLEDLREAGESFDAVILGNVLCEVDDQAHCLRLCHDLLKPGGRLYFVEHVLDEQHAWRGVLQSVVNPWWRVVSGGCNCNRRTVAAIHDAFGGPANCRSWRTRPKGPLAVPWLAPFELGVAVKRR